MNRKIKLSKTAEKKLTNLFDYLIQNWSVKVKSDFMKKLDKSLNIIKNNPEVFPESIHKKGLRKCVISKQTTLFYRFDHEFIKIVTIFDNRQNPKKLNKEI